MGTELLSVNLAPQSSKDNYQEAEASQAQEG